MQRLIAMFAAFVLAAFPVRAEKQDSAPRVRSRQLHVILLQDETKKPRNAVSDFDVVELPSGELPELLSRLLVREIAGSASPNLMDFGVPEKSMILDVHTFDITDEVLKQGKPLKRRNRLSRVRYDLTVKSWLTDFYEISLGGGGMKGISVRSAKNVTTLVRTNKKGRYLYGLTPLNATGLSHVGYKVGEVERRPTLIKQALPERPPGFKWEKNDVSCRALAIVKKDGSVAPGRLILLSCPHPVFARSLWSAVVREWTFEPGRVGGEPVDVRVEIEGEWTLR